MYDIHAHVLPGLDDGASDDETALAMLRASAERGVTHIVVTPHSYAVAAAGGRAVFEERLARAQALAGEHGLGLELLPGMEVRLVPEAAERLASVEYWPLGSSHCVLTEFDYTQWAAYAEEALFAIALTGYTPLLAHIERILPLLERPSLVKRFVERGCYTQITAMSLLGGMGPGPREGAERFLRQGLVHVVASDMHSPSGSRQPLPEGTYERLRELVGEAGAEALMYANPAAAVDGRPLQSVEPTPVKRRRFFWRN